MTPERKAEIEADCAEAKALADAATPGPWKTREHWKVHPSKTGGCVANVVTEDDSCPWSHIVGADGECQFANDAAFIASSRLLIPMLAEHCRELLDEVNRNDELRKIAAELYAKLKLALPHVGLVYVAIGEAPLAMQIAAALAHAAPLLEAT